MKQKDITEIKERLIRIEEHIRYLAKTINGCPQRHAEINRFMTRTNVILSIISFVGAVLLTAFIKLAVLHGG